MPLERATMIRTALTLLNEFGFDGLTVRRLAERLGVQNPALYWHFKKKQELLNEMAGTMLADAFAGIEPPPMNDQWADWLADVAERYHVMLLIYRDGALVIATADLKGSALQDIQEMALHVLTTAGFDLRTAFVSIITILDYTLGAAFEEQADPDYGTIHRSNPLQPRLLPLDPVRFPQLAAAQDEFTEGTVDDSQINFRGGIQLLLIGMAMTKQLSST